MKYKKLAMAVAVAVAGLSQAPVYATNGMMMTGYGFRSQAMGGVGIAYGRDSLSVAANPANAVKTGMRGDMGVGIFNAERHATVGCGSVSSSPDCSASVNSTTHSPFGFYGSVESDNKYFIMPEMGFTMPLTDKLSVGMAFVPNGGGDTTYRENFFAFPQGTNAFGARSVPPRNKTLGVDLMQLMAPITVAYKVNEHHAVGASLNIGVQRFRAYGLEVFPVFDPLYLNNTLLSDADHLTGQGFDYSYGAGVRLGWQGEFMDDRLTLGLTYASKTYMTKFDKYRGLFAGQGSFDMPENYGLGIAIKAAKNLTIAADVVRINYADVPAIGHRGPGTGAGASGVPSFPDHPELALGLDQGMGFGWKNQTVYKLGVNYGLNERWQLRAGYNYGKSPIPDDQLAFNTLAPATTEKHYSAGFTYKPNDNLEVTGTYVYAAPHSQQNLNQNVLGRVDIGMHQNIFALSLGWVLDPGVTDYGDTPSDPIDFGSGDHGWYAGLGLGQSKASDWAAADFNAQVAALGKAPNGAGADQRSTGFKAYAGYQFNRYLALEGGFADFNDVKATVTYTQTGNPRGSSYFTAENDAWMLAAVGTLPVTDKVSVFAKLGASNWSSNQRASSALITGQLIDSATYPYPQTDKVYRGVDPYYGVGASYALLDNLALRAEWERFKFDAPNINHIDLMTAGISMKF